MDNRPGRRGDFGASAKLVQRVGNVWQGVSNALQCTAGMNLSGSMLMQVYCRRVYSVHRSGRHLMGRIPIRFTLVRRPSDVEYCSCRRVAELRA